MTNLVWGASRRILDDDGDPHSGGKVYVYTAGTTTAVTTYSDSALTSANAHPVVADASGIVGPIFAAAGTYKIRVTDASDVVLYEDDNVRADAIPSSPVSPEDFGAVGDGATDDAVALQAWLDYLSSTEGVVGTMTNEYATRTDLIIRGPIKIDAAGWGADTNAAAQPSDAKPALKAKVGVVDLLTVVSDTASNFIWGVELRGFYLAGESVAERLLVLDGANRAVINLAGERANDAGLDLVEDNGRGSRFVEIESWLYQGGSSAAARAGHGFRMDGTTSSGITNIVITHMSCTAQPQLFSTVTNSSGDALFTFSTDHNFEVGDLVCVYNNTDRHYKAEWVAVATVPSSTTCTLTGVAYTVDATFGFMSASVGAWFGDCDSCQVGRYQGSSIYFAGNRELDSPPRRASRKNTIVHCGSHILLGNEARNTILNVNSEPSSVTVYGAGDATLGGAVIDRVNGRHFHWHNFKMTDQLELSASSAFHLNAVQTSLGGAPFECYSLPDATTASLNWTLPPKSDWYDGRITKAIIYYTGTNSGGLCKMVFKMDFALIGTAGVGNWDDSTAFDMNAPGTANVYTSHEVDLGDYAYNQGYIPQFKLERLGGDAGDTHNAAIYIYAVKVFYESDGPVTNYWDIPAFEFT